MKKSELKELVKSKLKSKLKEKKTSCSCGCGTCGNKPKISLQENKVFKKPLSENMEYHIKNNIPLHENIFRMGSKSYFKLIREARYHYSRGNLNLTGIDEWLIKETNLGEFGMFEGKQVPLDIPFVNEDFNPNISTGSIYAIEVKDLGNKVSLTQDNGQTVIAHKDDIDELTALLKSLDEMVKEIRGGEEKKFHDDYLNNAIEKLSKAYKILGVTKHETPKNKIKFIDITYRKSPTNKFDNDSVRVFYDTPEELEQIKSTLKLNEAEYQGKDVELDKPKRGGSKAYYVYVKDGDKVKKLSFGSGGLQAKINDPEARKAYAARHNCSDKKDKTTAGYWSCNLPKYAKHLGLKGGGNFYW